MNKFRLLNKPFFRLTPPHPLKNDFVKKFLFRISQLGYVSLFVVPWEIVFDGDNTDFYEKRIFKSYL